MPSSDTILNLLTLALLGVGGFLLTQLKASIGTSVEEATKAALKDLYWPAELARELQKTRGVERQELRYKSYGGLWKELRPLAIYDASEINRNAMKKFSGQLSDWYFSPEGGLLLTPQSRNFYFALQDLLRVSAAVLEQWSVPRFTEAEGEQKKTFRAVLGTDTEMTLVLDYFDAANFQDWQTRAPGLGKAWRAGVNRVAIRWETLDDRARFATLQQVGSILRSSLVNDLESRLQ